MLLLPLSLEACAFAPPCLLMRHIYSLILQQIEELVVGDVECSVVDASLDAIKDLFSHWSDEKGAEQLMCGRLVELWLVLACIERCGDGSSGRVEEEICCLWWVGDSQKNIEWHKLVVCCLSRAGDFALFYVRRPEISHQNIATTIFSWQNEPYYTCVQKGLWLLKWPYSDTLFWIDLFKAFVSNFSLSPTN